MEEETRGKEIGSLIAATYLVDARERNIRFQPITLIQLDCAGEQGLWLLKKMGNLSAGKYAIEDLPGSSLIPALA